jgi:hypothetical protein
MGKFFYLPPNAKTVKWTENSNAKSTNLTLESTKSQWQTLPWLVGWLGSPPWLNVKIKAKKPLADHLNRQTFQQGDFFPFLIEEFSPRYY